MDTRTVGAATESLTQSPEDAGLALAMASASNMLRSAFNFFSGACGNETPAGQRDRECSFFLSCAYLHEARVLLGGEFRRIRALVLEAGCGEDILKKATKALGRKGIGNSAAQVRNKLVFHWDREILADWASSQTSREPCWFESDGKRAVDTYHPIAGRAVFDLLFPKSPGSDVPENFDTFFDDMGDAIHAVLEVLDCALVGYVQRFLPKPTDSR